MINKQAKITATVILAAFLLSFIAIFIVSGLENNSILLDDVAQDSINNSITFEFTEDTKTFYLDLEKQDYTKAEIDITGINISDLSIDILANDEIDFNVNEFNSKETLNFLDLLIPYIDNCGIYPCNIPFTVVASTGILIFDNLVLEYGEIEEVIEENITEEIEEAIEINETIEEIIDEKIEEVIEENITEEIEEAIVEETSIENQQTQLKEEIVSIVFHLEEEMELLQFLIKLLTALI